MSRNIIPKSVNDRWKILASLVVRYYHLFVIPFKISFELVYFCDEYWSTGFCLWFLSFFLRVYSWYSTESRACIFVWLSEKIVSNYFVWTTSFVKLIQFKRLGQFVHFLLPKKDKFSQQILVFSSLYNFRFFFLQFWLVKN